MFIIRSMEVKFQSLIKLLKKPTEYNEDIEILHEVSMENSLNKSPKL